MKKTGTIIYLIDHSTGHPKGILEDVLVEVNELIFAANFYILDIGIVDVSDKKSFILGRSFMKNSKTKIDVFASMLSLEFDGDVVKFKDNDANFTSNNVYVNFIGTNSPLSEDCCEYSDDFVQEIFSDRSFSFSALRKLTEKAMLGEEEKNDFSKKKLK